MNICAAIWKQKSKQTQCQAGVVLSMASSLTPPSQSREIHNPLSTQKVVLNFIEERKEGELINSYI
jgi:hypothetical protein